MKNERIVEKTNSDTYLLNGEIKRWDGPTSNVYSSIQTFDTDGNKTQTLLGSIPDMDGEVDCSNKEIKSAIDDLLGEDVY